MNLVNSIHRQAPTKQVRDLRDYGSKRLWQYAENRYVRMILEKEFPTMLTS